MSHWRNARTRSINEHTHVTRTVMEITQQHAAATALAITTPRNSDHDVWLFSKQQPFRPKHSTRLRSAITPHRSCADAKRIPTYLYVQTGKVPCEPDTPEANGGLRRRLCCMFVCVLFQITIPSHNVCYSYTTKRLWHVAFYGAASHGTDSMCMFAQRSYKPHRNAPDKNMFLIQPE